MSNRVYKFKDVDMLTASSTIVESAIAQKALLQSKRSNWADPFFEDLKTRIDTALNVHLGIDSAKEMRMATIAVKGIQAMAIKDLAEAKVQLSEDFKTDKLLRNELLTQLGFSTYHKAAQNKDQEALVSLLYRFSTNLTPTLKAQIIGKGMAESTLDKISAYAVTLKNANVGQEGFKVSRKVISAAAFNEFNSIYNEIISICKIASKFYKDQPAVQGMFNFTKVSSAINAHGSAPTTTTTPHL